MIGLDDSLMLLQAVLLVLKHFGVTPPVDDQLLTKTARRILPALSKSKSVQNAVFWLRVQSEDGVVRLASAWEVVKRLLDANIDLFWTIAMDLCSGLHPSEWMQKVRSASAQLHGKLDSQSQPASVQGDKSVSGGQKGKIVLPNSKL